MLAPQADVAAIVSQIDGLLQSAEDRMTACPDEADAIALTLLAGALREAAAAAREIASAVRETAVITAPTLSAIFEDGRKCGIRQERERSAAAGRPLFLVPPVSA